MDSVMFVTDARHLPRILARIPKALDVYDLDRVGCAGALMVRRGDEHVALVWSTLAFDSPGDVWDAGNLPLVRARMSDPVVCAVESKNIRFRNELMCELLDDSDVLVDNGFSTVFFGPEFVARLRASINAPWVLDGHTEPGSNSSSDRS